MSQYGKTGEESMEEILASIRSSVDTPEAASAAQSAPPPEPGPELGNGAAPTRGLNTPPSNAGGRLQDALRSVAPQDAAQVAPTSTPTLSSQTTPEQVTSKQATPKAPSAPTTSGPAAPTRPNGLSSNGTGTAPSTAGDDLSDLFAEPTPSSQSAQTNGTAPFGTAPKTSATPASAPKASGTPLSSEDAAALVKPSLAPSSMPEASQPPAAPEVIASMAPSPRAADSALSPGIDSEMGQGTVSEPAPASGDIEPKPKREPSFAALKTLASGQTPAKATQAGSAQASSTSSVLLPQMRDLPGTNPVAEMQSMAATSSPAKTNGVSETGGFMSTPSSSTLSTGSGAPTPPATLAEPTTQPDNKDAAAGDAARSQTPPPAAAAGLADGARVEATAGSRSLEDIVVELLKPQLAQWLEANMPRIVERALRAEQGGSSDKDSS